MKTSLKTAVLATLFTATLGLTAFTSGCAATATKESTGEYVDDSSITLKVKAALLKDPTVKGLEVNVETFKGTVQLSGFVSTSEEKAQAGRVTAMVKGVAAINNNIIVK